MVRFVNESSFTKTMNKHNCSTFQEKFNRYLANNFTEEEEIVFNKELIGCDKCQQFLAEERELKSMLLTMPIPLDELEMRKKRVLANVLQNKIVPNSFFKRVLLQTSRYAIAASILLLLFVSGLFIDLNKSKSFALEDLVDYHCRCVSEEHYTDYEFQLEEDFKKNMSASKDLTVIPIDMQKHHGFLASDICMIDNVRFMHILYKDNKSVISHFHAISQISFQKEGLHLNAEKKVWTGKIDGKNIVAIRNDENSASYFVSEITIEDLIEWVLNEPKS